MGFLDLDFKEKKANGTSGTLHEGRASEVNLSVGAVSSFRGKSVKLMQRLQQTYDVYDAIHLLIDEDPDVSMGFAVLQALVNQGGKIKFSGCARASAAKITKEWKKFAERLNSVGAGGLDGLMAQLHGLDFAEGAMSCEVVFNDDLSDIEDVYPVPPSTVRWKLERRSGKQIWVPYQYVNGKQIDLSGANFLWIPFNPMITPDGSLLFAPAVPAADMQLMFFNSLQTVLYRIGCPRYDVKLNKERLMASAPAEIKTSVEKTKAYIKSVYDSMEGKFRGMSAENDIIHTDDIEIGVIGGESSAFFQGISAYADIVDVQMMNAVKTLGTLMNRRGSGGSYALSSVEFKVIVDMLEPRQRAEKRLIESIARLWLRIHGYNADVKYTPNPIEWQKMLDKIDYALKNQEFNRRSEEYGYISPDAAAHDVNNVDKAYKPTENIYEYLKKRIDNTTVDTDSAAENTDGGEEN